MKTEPTSVDEKIGTDRRTVAHPRGRKWAAVAVNILLALAIIALLVATWMPAIYDRLSTTKPSP